MIFSLPECNAYHGWWHCWSCLSLTMTLKYSKSSWSPVLLMTVKTIDSENDYDCWHRLSGFFGKQSGAEGELWAYTSCIGNCLIIYQRWIKPASLVVVDSFLAIQHGNGKPLDEWFPHVSSMLIFHGWKMSSGKNCTLLLFVDGWYPVLLIGDHSLPLLVPSPVSLCPTVWLILFLSP